MSPRSVTGIAAHRDRLAAVAVGAASDSGVAAELLGDFLTDAAHAIRSGRRLTERRVRRYEAEGERAANDGVALPALIDLYLSAAWRLWREVPALTTDTAGVSPAPLLDAGGGMLRTSDDVVAAVTAGYQRAHAQRVEQSAATRREFVDDLLANHGELGDLSARGEAFGLQLSARHRVAVVRVPGQRIDESHTLLGTAAQACQGLPHAPQFLVSSKDGNLVVILEGPDATTRVGIERLARVVRDAHGELRLGVGRGRPGESGPMRSFREATECLHLASLIDAAGDDAYADDLIAYLALSRDRELLVELVASVLQPLATLRGGPAEATTTLQAYLDNQGSATATANALHLSVRGLTYRMERIQAALRHDIGDPHQRLTVELALLAARLLDWPAREFAASDVT